MTAALLTHFEIDPKAGARAALFTAVSDLRVDAVLVRCAVVEAERRREDAGVLAVVGAAVLRDLKM